MKLRPRDKWRSVVSGHMKQKWVGMPALLKGKEISLWISVKPVFHPGFDTTELSSPGDTLEKCWRPCPLGAGCMSLLSLTHLWCWKEQKWWCGCPLTRSFMHSLFLPVPEKAY